MSMEKVLLIENLGEEPFLGRYNLTIFFGWTPKVLTTVIFLFPHAHFVIKS